MFVVQTMDSMDIDQVVNVPDTPDRASRPNRNASVCINESISSLSGDLKDRDICDEELRNQRSVNTKLIIENRGKRLLFRPVNNLRGSDNPECRTNSIRNSNNASSCTSVVSDRATNHQNDISFHSQLMGKGKAPSSYESFACNEGGTDVDSTEDQKTAQNGAYRLNRNTVVCADKEINSSLSGNLTNGDICDVELRNQKSVKPKLIIDNRGRRVLMHSAENLSVSDNSECRNYAVRNSSSSNNATRNSSSSNNAPSCTRMISDRATNHENHLSFHAQLIGKGKAPTTSELFAGDEGGTVVHLTEDWRTFQNGTSRTCHPKKESICTNGLSSMHHMANTSKGKEKVDNRGSVGSSAGQLKGLPLPVVDQYEGAKTVSNTLPAAASPRVVGQRRLVRNGCISPRNIAKAKQLAEKHDNESSSVLQNNMETVTPSIQSDLFSLRNLVAEESSMDRVKGKGLINYSYSSKEPSTKILDLSSRSSKNSQGSGDAHKHSEELVGWRSTHNNVEKSNFLLSDEECRPSRRKDGAIFGDHQHANRAVRRVRGSGITVSNDHSEDQGLLSREIVRPVTRNKSRLGQSGEHQHPANTPLKRQKHDCALRNGGECSSSADSEIVFVGSPGEPSNFRSTRTQNSHVLGISNPVIEIDDSPEIRQNSSHRLGSSSNNTQDVRERQVEADELLARELQEQLYNEIPGVGIAEIDAQLALALLQQDSQHGFSGGGLSTPYSRRGGPLRSSQSSSAQVRVPTTRMARLRNHFRGMPPRSLLSRARDSLFPPNMDTDMRIRILEALEAASDMGMLNNMLQVDRDFNENDYEMLLALDENNHQVGVSVDRINSLPESKVQSDNFEEDCAICLETPTTGDTIRHLPCLHKFHKDCIDTWLRRKTSCPVCKSSIT